MSTMTGIDHNDKVIAYFPNVQGTYICSWHTVQWQQRQQGKR